MRSWRVLAIALAVAFGLAGTALAHPEPGDVDGDTVGDAVDNCPYVYNFDQANDDGDQHGDRCDADYDGDGDTVAPEYRYPGGPPADNCPGTWNKDQLDTDGDGVGDVCDVDTDVDGTADVFDNCPTTYNFGQGDIDADTQGDACDGDMDGDGLANGADNCADVYNPDQRDDDRDGRGYLCDADDRPAGTGPSPSPPARDAIKPALRLSSLRGFERADLTTGLPVQLRASEACSIAGRLVAGRRTLARGRAALTGAGTTYVFLRANAKTMRWLAGRDRVRVTLHLRAVDGSGNALAVKRTLRLG
jgi:hypothetical protein